MSKKPQRVLSVPQIEQSILFIRGHKVLLDSDLAKLYGVETKTLVRAMKRNVERFPGDFMFQLSSDEWAVLSRQIGTLGLRRQIGASSSAVPETTPHGGRRYAPYAFTEQGVAMLSSVLRSKRAVQVNIEIMRAFVRLRQILAVNAELASRLDEVERQLGKHSEQFVQVIRAIRQLMEPPAAPKRRRIGFHAAVDESSSEPSARRRKSK